MSDEVIQQLQQRVARLEEEVRQLKARQGGDERPWWQQISGSHAGSEVFEEVVREIQKNRNADYAAARKEADRRKSRGTKKARRPVGKKVK